MSSTATHDVLTRLPHTAPTGLTCIERVHPLPWQVEAAPDGVATVVDANGTLIARMANDGADATLAFLFVGALQDANELYPRDSD